MDTYKVGSKSEHIKFAVDIQTFGLARTKALVVNPDKSISAKMASNDATGDIVRNTLDTAENLAGKDMIVYTEISLGIIKSQQDRKIEFDNLKAEYILEGGTDEYKKYSESDSKTADESYRRVALIKEISFKF